MSGLDFRREGAWRKRVAAIRSARHQLLRSGAFGALNLFAPPAAVGTKVTGRVIVPVIPIAFRNAPPPFPSSSYDELFFSQTPVGRPYSLKTFYEQLSNGNITVEGRTVPWVTADSADAYYEDGCNGIGVLAPCPPRPVSRFGELLLRTLDVVSHGPEAATLWSQFDNDGPDGLPNSGDDDGTVDFVTFLQPEQDGACPDSPHIWAHRFVIRAWNGGSPYVTQTPWAGHPGQFLKVDDYIMQSAVGGDTACDASSLMPVGTVAHETGHAFGLPDLYDTDLGNPQVTQGIGEWGLMGSGNYARPYSPARYEAWSLFELGWVTADTLSSGRDVRLGPVATSDTVLYLPVPGTDEYYLFENRQAQESDSAQMNPAFGSRQKAPGLLVWHIDQGQLDEHGFDRDNRVNVGPVHGVMLVQADGRNDLGQPGGTNRGDTGDSFPGSSGNGSLCQTTNPPASDNQGAFARFCLDGITQLTPGGGIAFHYVAYRSVFAADHAGAMIKVNGSTLSRLDQFFPPGALIELSIDSVQLDEPARRKFDFLAWSDGGARTHSITAREVPDTIVAQVALGYRLRLSVQGATMTAVSSGVAGDVSSGVYLAEGSQVSFRAAPQAGAVFAGWTGDTTSTQDTLTLHMRHPYDLMANFVEVHEVVLGNAADALLGTEVLLSEEATYLDAVGNRNGVYDLGDFLAASDRRALIAAVSR
ncbi:MAG TPA: M6 family metalloprotease domain-containing protein [Gemmatimonadales bacterium]